MSVQVHSQFARLQLGNLVDFFVEEDRPLASQAPSFSAAGVVEQEELSWQEKMQRAEDKVCLCALYLNINCH